MATNQELEAQLARMTQIVAERDRKDAEARAAAQAAQAATDAAKSADERAKLAAEEKESIRRGAFFSFLLGKAAPGEVVDLTQLQKQIPADPDVWPEGVDASQFVFLSGGRIKPEDKQDVAATTLGKLLLSMKPKL